MNVNSRIEIIARLGELLRTEAWENSISESIANNPWFNKKWIDLSISSWAQALTSSNISKWIARYPTLSTPTLPLKVQIVMAGNLPLVGLHDLLCIFLSGHKAVAKLSSKDKVLMLALVNKLKEEFPDLKDYIELSDALSQESDAIIATGTDSTKLFFEAEYQDIPGIFRGNRNSVALLSGMESDDELASLSLDLLSYYGLGCRNVSHIISPNKDTLIRLSEVLRNSSQDIQNQGYINSITQNRAVFTLRKQEFIDAHDILLIESEQISSPVGIVNYQISGSQSYTKNWISANSDSIQCIVSSLDGFESSVKPGQSQYPELWDYSDNIDTLNFLINLPTP